MSCHMDFPLLIAGSLTIYCSILCLSLYQSLQFMGFKELVVFFYDFCFSIFTSCSSVFLYCELEDWRLASLLCCRFLLSRYLIYEYFCEIDCVAVQLKQCSSRRCLFFDRMIFIRKCLFRKHPYLK